MNIKCLGLTYILLNARSVQELLAAELTETEERDAQKRHELVLTGRMQCYARVDNSI